MQNMFIPYISEFQINETIKSMMKNSAGWDFIYYLSIKKM